MARSIYIYLAYNHAEELLGAWTVRYELVAYGKSTLTCHRDYQIRRAVRVKDGIGAGCETYQCDDITKSIKKSIGTVN